MFGTSFLMDEDVYGKAVVWYVRDTELPHSMDSLEIKRCAIEPEVYEIVRNNLIRDPTIVCIGPMTNNTYGTHAEYLTQESTILRRSDPGLIKLGLSEVDPQAKFILIEGHDPRLIRSTAQKIGLESLVPSKVVEITTSS